MDTYRKETIEVKAVKWKGFNIPEIVAFSKPANPNVTHPTWLFETETRSVIIPAPQGNLKAGIGDWIIKGTEGEFSVCFPEVFDKTYELVESGTKESLG